MNFSSNVLNNRTAVVCDTFAEATKYLDYVMDRSGLDPDNLLAYTMEYAQGVPGMTDRDWVLVTYWTVGRPQFGRDRLYAIWIEVDGEPLFMEKPEKLVDMVR